MLQRAASNAYSWWWASNIRTKQSKWLDSNVQEMEEKKETMIKLIKVDADSFAKKAEMYYQRRPELLKLAEEMYKAYKALADRYDRISGELHKANNTLASAFPDQFHFAMQDDDDEDGSPRAIDTSKFRKALHGEVPQINLRNKCQDASSALKKHHKNVSSHLTEVNAQREIDRLQKEILVLQTEKEFVKGSYESGLAKFWNIENQITDLQDQVCSLEDEYNAGSIIEDDEARALMAATAIKSCEESLASLQHQQLKSGEEVDMESKRIREAKDRLKFLMGEKYSPEIAKNFDKDTSDKEEQPFHLKNGGPEALDLHSVCVQLKQHFQMNSATSVVDLAEKIDELVEKVITLEVTVSSQTAQIQTLRSETDGLLKHLRGLEEEKAILITDSNCLNVRVRQAEDELHRVQDLEKVIDHEKGIFRTHFLDACNSLDDISEKLRSPGHKKDNITSASSSIESLKKNVVKENGAKNEFHGKQIESNAKDTKDQSHSHEASTPFVNNSSSLKDLELDDITNGPDSRQKMLIFEYTSVLQNYKDTKKRLIEMDKKNQEYHFEMMAHIHDLKSGSAIKDQEIRALRRKLFSQTTSEGLTTSLNEGQLVNGEENGSSAQLLAAKLDSLDTEVETELCFLEQQQSSSQIEEKFRSALDTLLDENLDFWLRFSTSYHHIQKFEASFKELQVDLDKLKNSTECRSAPASPMHSSKQDMMPLDKKMRELHTELRVWLEKNGLLKGELQCRFASLCSIQEEIAKAWRDGEGEDSKFTPYQAAKFQGELLNMQHENNKVAKELQTGLDHVKALQSEVVKALSRLRESFDLSATNGYQNFRHCSTKSKVPLRTFLFGEKRKKPSIFSCISPALHRHHNQLKYGFPS